MNTKRLIRLLMMLGIILTSNSFSAEAGSTQNSNHKGNGSAVLDLHAHETKSKRMPSGISLEVDYTDGVLTLTSDYYEGSFSLSFENYETGATYTVPSIQIGQSVPLALETGEYELIAVGENGTELSGFMQVY